MGSIVHRSVPTNLKWFPTCSHAHAMFQDRFKDVQVGSRWFSTLYILSPNFHTLCQYFLRSKRGLAQASPGLAQASPSLKAPRFQAFEARDLLHQHNRKGQLVMIKTRRHKRLVFGFVFGT